MEESDHPENLLATALGHFRAGRDEEAAVLCHRVLTADAANAGALHLWGALEAKAGRVDAAITHLEKAIALHPASPKYHNSLGAAYAQKRHFAHAVHHFWQALAREPHYPPALKNLGQALGELGYAAEAERIRELAAALDPNEPDNPEALYRLGLRQYDADEFHDAIEWFRKAVAQKPDFVDARRLLIDALWQEGRVDEALANCREMLAILPDEPESLRSSGVLLQRTGKVKEAVISLQESIKRAPEYAEPYLTLTECKRFVAGDPEIERLKSLCGNESLAPKDKVILYYALGKVYVDLQDYDRAFECFRLGSALKRPLVDYDPDRRTRQVNDLIEFFDEARFAEIGDRFATYSRLPIFIVGMPRSGTSLVEQIIASHPVVYGAGELNDVRRVSQRMPSLVQPHTPFPDCLARLSPIVARKLATEYVDRLCGLAPDAAHVTDKMPWNFHTLGLIAFLWPYAKIIHCMRDPLDTCVSCYTRYFSAGQPFSWDLVELGHYYREYQRLAEHWRAVLPSPILEVPYERLVADQEQVTREMLDFCHLDWDDRCLAFYETDRPVMTNPIDVRRPIYGSSIERWRKFESHLGPLRRALAGELDPRGA